MSTTQTLASSGPVGGEAFSDTLAHWLPLTRPRASDLADTRKQLHWAAQIVAAVGTSLLEPRADDSHTNLEWSRSEQGLLGQVVESGLRALLRFPTMTIELVRERGEGGLAALHVVELNGRRFTEVLTDLERAIADALGHPVTLRRPALELPSHRVDPDGAAEPFGRWKDHALVELTRWFANGDRALRELAAADPRATPVRCWPHHFDIATLLVIDDERSVGVGMTPGDGSYADAYWYVTPRPAPTAPELRALEGGGIWHHPATGLDRDAWFGAVLTSTALREPQAERFTAFLRSALAACESMVLA